MCSFIFSQVIKSFFGARSMDSWFLVLKPTFHISSVMSFIARTTIVEVPNPDQDLIGNL